MKNKTTAILLLGIFLLSLASAYTYCEDGNAGAVKITSLKGSSDWKWEEGEDIEITVLVENNRENRSNFTTELIFLDDNDSILYIVNDMSDLKETKRISGDDEETFKFKFELDEDILMDNYNLFVKTYITENESAYCYQSEKTIRINTFDACSSNPNLTITSVKGSSDFDWWINEEESVSVEIKSLFTREKDYNIELVFYQGATEIELAYDLSKQESFANGTFTVKFDFTIDEEITEGKYGLYVKVTSGDDCAEKRTSEPYKKGRKTLQRYDHIFIQDIDGIIITEIDGPSEITSGVESIFKVTIANTGDDEEQVTVWAYNKISGIKIPVVIDYFKKGTTKEIQIPVLANYDGSIKLLFFANYGYKNKSGTYHESTSDYNHDMEQLVKIFPKVVEIPKTIPKKTTDLKPVEPVAQGPKEKESRTTLMIAIVGILISIIIVIVVYRKLNKDNVVQTNPYS